MSENKVYIVPGSPEDFGRRGAEAKAKADADEFANQCRRFRASMKTVLDIDIPDSEDVCTALIPGFGFRVYGLGGKLYAAITEVKPIYITPLYEVSGWASLHNYQDCLDKGYVETNETWRARYYHQKAASQ